MRMRLVVSLRRIGSTAADHGYGGKHGENADVAPGGNAEQAWLRGDDIDQSTGTMIARCRGALGAT